MREDAGLAPAVFSHVVLDVVSHKTGAALIGSGLAHDV
jgi:hypothetical protein